MSTALQPLWKIEAELQELLDCIDTCSEEHQPELQAKIATYLAHEATKVDSCAHVLAAMEYAEKNHDDEIERLKQNKAAIKKARERFEQYLCRVIGARGVKKLEGNTNKLSVRDSEAVSIVNEELVPDEYKTATVKMPLAAWRAVEEAIVCSMDTGDWLVKQTVIDKSAIRERLKDGAVIPGADLEFRKHLKRS